MRGVDGGLISINPKPTLKEVLWLPTSHDLFNQYSDIPQLKRSKINGTIQNTHLVLNSQKCQQPRLWHGHPHQPKAWQDQSLRHEAPSFHQGECCWTLCHDAQFLESSHDASMPDPWLNQELFSNEHSNSITALQAHVLRRTKKIKKG